MKISSKMFKIPDEKIELYGKYKAKISDEYYEEIKNKKDGKLILMTSINPTPFGEGKTTVAQSRKCLSQVELERFRGFSRLNRRSCNSALRQSRKKLPRSEDSEQVYPQKKARGVDGATARISGGSVRVCDIWRRGVMFPVVIASR